VAPAHPSLIARRRATMFAWLGAISINSLRPLESGADRGHRSCGAPPSIRAPLAAVMVIP